MLKKLTKADYLFAASLLTVFLLTSFFIFTYPDIYDESFYSTIPFRLIKGDSLIQNEWHLTQFSSFFSYLPLRFWLHFKGSAEGIVLFSRCVYISIHTSMAIAIYIFFRKHKIWAIAASMIFFTQVPYRIFSISYHSMFVVFLILFVFCLTSIYDNPLPKFYVLAGMCYGLCCINNPFFCFAFLIYLFFCILIFYKEKFKADNKSTTISAMQSKGKRQKKSNKKEQTNSTIVSNYNNIFFSKEAIFYSLCGIIIIAAIAVAFFFVTGGSFSFLLNNLKYIFMDNEYELDSFNLIFKFKLLLSEYSDMCFDMPYLLPLLYITMIFDKKKYAQSHRYFYLIVAFILASMCILKMLYKNSSNNYAFEQPFFIISVACFILTENKNKKLFCCFWVPSAIASLFHYFAATSYLLAINIVLVVNNIAGVMFVGDLFNEMSSNRESKLKPNKASPTFGKIILCAGICLQLLFHGFILQYEQIPETTVTRASEGPYSGLLMTEQQLTVYTKSLSDLDLIKKRSHETDPVLISSFENWMYMHIDRPYATYTSWYYGRLNANKLTMYYKENPDRIPKYIYIDSVGYYGNDDSGMITDNMEIVDQLFIYEEEQLLNGILLTVIDKKF